MTVLEDLYYGNLSPWCEYTPSNKTVKAVRNNNNNLDNLSEMLDTKSQQEAINAVINSQSKVLALTEKDAFLAGLKLGIKVMFEVFTD